MFLELDVIGEINFFTFLPFRQKRVMLQKAHARLMKQSMTTECTLPIILNFSFIFPRFSVRRNFLKGLEVCCWEFSFESYQSPLLFFLCLSRFFKFCNKQNILTEVRHSVVFGLVSFNPLFEKRNRCSCFPLCNSARWDKCRRKLKPNWQTIFVWRVCNHFRYHFLFVCVFFFPLELKAVSYSL